MTRFTLAALLMLGCASCAKPQDREWWALAAPRNITMIDAKAIERASSGRVFGIVYELYEIEGDGLRTNRARHEIDCAGGRYRATHSDTFRSNRQKIDFLVATGEWLPFKDEKTVGGAINRFFCASPKDWAKPWVRIERSPYLDEIAFMLDKPWGPSQVSDPKE